MTRGCLSKRDMMIFRRMLKSASFALPPPPDVTCQALPIRRIVYRDLIRSRTVSEETPCGRRPIHKSVRELGRHVRQLVAPSVPLPTPTPPRPPHSACKPTGQVLVSAYSRPLRNRASRGRSVQINTNGAWYEEHARSHRCGVLGRNQLARVRQLVRQHPRIAGIKLRVVCKALPHNSYGVRTARDDVHWKAPCGSTKPSADAAALHAEIMKLRL
jgi:hypothetical protein